MIRFQSVIVSAICSWAHSFLFWMWTALRNGFLAAMQWVTSRRVFRALWTVVGCTGEGRERLRSVVMSWRDWCRSHRMLRLRCRSPQLLIFEGLSVRGLFSLWPLLASLLTITWIVCKGVWNWIAICESDWPTAACSHMDLQNSGVVSCDPSRRGMRGCVKNEKLKFQDM